ncbi:hypothetical protein H5185_12065 [Shewanella sp. SG44-6]|jgi:hypothetical protein|uniref:conjugative transfer protein MobI(A/C) n=1 Tax=Shewanella sp. SG44-6 TaxID=2760959 RepID=UPI001604658C|nr:conjugative transfer protein MobI(A/C) [Shewanella sp. SG44-6]MBB1390148.1 hypothetical protein [Shewanella sp. SG44-6]
MYIKFLQTAIDGIEKQRSELEGMAVELIDEYWLEWRMKNAELKKYSKPGEFLGGEVAPRAVTRTGKLYLEWLRFSPGRLGKRSKSWGDKIPEGVRGYSADSIASRSPDWERELIERTEKELALLRGVITVLHESKIKLNRQIRNYIKKEIQDA